MRHSACAPCMAPRSLSHTIFPAAHEARRIYIVALGFQPETPQNFGGPEKPTALAVIG
jgi:hypothetical protein